MLTALLIALAVGVSFWASSHVLLYRADPRAALWWTAVVWLLPFLGAMLYYLFGINRIRRRVRRLYHPSKKIFKRMVPSRFFSRRADRMPVTSSMRYLFSLAKIGEQVTGRPLLFGNEVTPLRNGDEAYPAMVNAIDASGKTISLSTYIFKFDEAGEIFIDALRRARARGVEVRVLLDDLGSGLFFSKVGRLFQQHSIPVSTFNPPLSVANLPYMNLRNHRKLLIADGRVGFCGGMNIHKENMVDMYPEGATHDWHFRIEGPAVAHLQEAFVEDWYFAAKEKLTGRQWFPNLMPKGAAYCRGIAHGPDENFERMRWILLGAINTAQKSIHIVSPYFIPDQALMNALRVATLRGVRIDIVLPATNDSALVSWASTAYIRQALEGGCRVHMSPPPFDHSKLMLVDGGWTLFGSSNWDTRSLRLNFEFNVECYDEQLTGKLLNHVITRMRDGRELSLDQIEKRPLPVKLRDGMARLFAPHL